jgi:hypothetical protein
MGLISRLEQEEKDADALILSSQNNPTEPQLDTGDEETQPITNQVVRTPVNTDSELLWEQKYKALQGKYNAEVPRLQQQLADKSTDNGESERYRSENSSLKSQLESVNAQLEAKGQLDADTRDKYLDEEYGEEFTNSIDKRIDAKTNSTNQQLKKMQETNQQNQIDMRKVALSGMLKAQGIDFEQVDSDPMFHQYLTKSEGNTRQQRQVFLNQNFMAGDLHATAAYYTEFKAHERSSLKANPLDNHVDVSSNNGAPDAGDEPDIWTTDDMNRLYDDYTKGNITEEVFVSEEQRFFRAQDAGNFRA